MEEQWKPIKGYEGFYEVSNLGNIRRLCKKYICGRPVKLQKDKDGYNIVCLSKHNKRATHKVHRLVAKAFIPNPNNHPVINHIDEIKTNNSVDNLEWCTVRYNNVYNDGIEKRMKKNRIRIKAIKDNEIIFFDSITEASRKLNVNRANIIGCLKKYYGRKTCDGYKFEYD